MPRNGSGTFSVENPIVVGALRSSSVVNANFTDMGDEITNSLPIDGQAGMSGQFKAAVPLLSSQPGISWANDNNTGFRRTGPDAMAWMAGGQDRATMDANGKLSLAGGLSVAGAFTHTTGFNPQTLAVASAASSALTLRNTSNDTDEHVLAKYQSGSGSGASGELRVVGGGANDVATMRFYVNDVLAFQWTSALFTHSVDTLFGASGIRADTDGFLDFPELSAAPSAPAANVARAYGRDDSGTTRLYYKDGSGTELPWQPPTNRQVFTSSSTWTKPTQGQTQALIECWGGGGSGGRSPDGAGGGGGGAYARRIIALASLSASVAVTVGAGGTGLTFADHGNNGGTTRFGSFGNAYLTAFGGGGGGENPSGDDCDGGGGGGLTSAGNFPTGADSGTGGGPNGFLGLSEWGTGDATTANDNPFGGGAGGEENAEHNGRSAILGGGGGAPAPSGGANFDGGFSFYGGGGGARDNGGNGGASIGGGNGGASATAGTAPAGGGGGSDSNTNPSGSGAGARGEVRVTCW